MGDDMKEIIIVRHGESEHQVKQLTGGWTNYSLTNHGKKQAEQTGLKLKEILLDKKFDFYSSDLVRAKETAEIIGEFINKNPKLSKELRGLDNGVASGLSKQESKKFELPVIEPIIDWIPYRNAESRRTLYKRVYSFLEKVSNSNNSSILLITHAKALTCIVNWWLGIHEEKHLNNIIYYSDACSITHLKKDHLGHHEILRINDVSHLIG